MRRVLLCAAIILPLISGSAMAQTTISYDVEVTSTGGGPHASLFPIGQRLLVTYTLDPAATDSSADPARGVFSNAVLSMSISFPGTPISASTGAAGTAQTFDNVGACQVSDQVFIHGGPIISATPLGGENVDSVEVDFLSDFVVTPNVPFMLSSDALPLSPLRFHDAFVIFRTASGNTFVHFHLLPGDRVRRMITEVETLRAIGILTASQADRLLSELEAAANGFDRGNTRQGTDNLKDFIDRVNDLIDENAFSSVRGGQLIDTARRIRWRFGF